MADYVLSDGVGTSVREDTGEQEGYVDVDIEQLDAAAAVAKSNELIVQDGANAPKRATVSAVVSSAFAGATNETISSGVLNIASHAIVAGEGAAADDLTEIQNATGVLFLRPGGQTITLKDHGSDVFNKIRTPNGSDYVLPTGVWTLLFRYADSEAWRVVGPAGGAGWDGDITDMNITGADDIGEALADDDEFAVYNLSGTAVVKSVISRLWTYISGKLASFKLDDLAAADDNTDLDATTSAHGLLPKLGGGTTNYLRADGCWAEPAGGGGSGTGWTLIGSDTVVGSPASALTVTNDDAITGVDTGAKTFTVSGDVTAEIVDGQTIRVAGSTGNDGNYTVSGSPSFGGGSTTITVSEAIPDATVDGTIYHLPVYDEYQVAYDITAHSTSEWVQWRANGDAAGNYYLDNNDSTSTTPNILYMYNNGASVGFANLMVASDGRRMFSTTSVRWDGSKNDTIWATSIHSPTTGGFTSLALVSTTASNIKVGSKLVLFGRNWS